MSAISDLSIKQLRHVVNLKEKIESLERELAGLIGENPAHPWRPKRKYRISSAARERIAAAQRARWAGFRKSGGKIRRTLSPAGRARIAAAARARWAKSKRSGK